MNARRAVPAGDLTPGQRAFLDHLLTTELAESLYLSGGTALAAFHLHHRWSEDLDLFSRHPVDAKAVVRLVGAIAEREPVAHRIQDRLGFILEIAGAPLRVEFVHYDFDPIEPPVPRYGKLRVDGLRDILANKLSAILERTEPKDYTDLLFLLRTPPLTLEQGIRDCRAKFGWPGLPHLVQTALLKVDALSGWPETEPPTSLEEARAYFRQTVGRLASSSI